MQRFIKPRIRVAPAKIDVFCIMCLCSMMLAIATLIYFLIFAATIRQK